MVRSEHFAVTRKPRSGPSSSSRSNLNPIRIAFDRLFIPREPVLQGKGPFGDDLAADGLIPDVHRGHDDGQDGIPGRSNQRRRLRRQRARKPSSSAGTESDPAGRAEVLIDSRILRR